MEPASDVACRNYEIPGLPNEDRDLVSASPRRSRPLGRAHARPQHWPRRPQPVATLGNPSQMSLTSRGTRNFGSFTLCGEGRYPKTFLLPGQSAKGEKLWHSPHQSGTATGRNRNGARTGRRGRGRIRTLRASRSLCFDRRGSVAGRRCFRRGRTRDRLSRRTIQCRGG